MERRSRNQGVPYPPADSPKGSATPRGRGTVNAYEAGRNHNPQVVEQRTSPVFDFALDYGDEDDNSSEDNQSWDSAQGRGGVQWEVPQPDIVPEMSHEKCRRRAYEFYGRSASASYAEQQLTPSERYTLAVQQRSTVNFAAPQQSGIPAFLDPVRGIGIVDFVEVNLPLPPMPPVLVRNPEELNQMTRNVTSIARQGERSVVLHGSNQIKKPQPIRHLANTGNPSFVRHGGPTLDGERQPSRLTGNSGAQSFERPVSNPVEGQHQSPPQETHQSYGRHGLTRVERQHQPPPQFFVRHGVHQVEGQHQPPPQGAQSFVRDYMGNSQLTLNSCNLNPHRHGRSSRTMGNPGAQASFVGPRIQQNQVEHWLPTIPMPNPDFFGNQICRPLQLQSSESPWLTQDPNPNMPSQNQIMRQGLPLRQGNPIFNTSPGLAGASSRMEQPPRLDYEANPSTNNWPRCPTAGFLSHNQQGYLQHQMYKPPPGRVGRYHPYRQWHSHETQGNQPQNPYQHYETPTTGPRPRPVELVRRQPPNIDYNISFRNQASRRVRPRADIPITSQGTTQMLSGYTWSPLRGGSGAETQFKTNIVGRTSDRGAGVSSTQALASQSIGTGAVEETGEIEIGDDSASVDTEIVEKASDKGDEFTSVEPDVQEPHDKDSSTYSTEVVLETSDCDYEPESKSTDGHLSEDLGPLSVCPTGEMDNDGNGNKSSTVVGVGEATKHEPSGNVTDDDINELEKGLGHMSTSMKLKGVDGSGCLL